MEISFNDELLSVDCGLFIADCGPARQTNILLINKMVFVGLAACGLRISDYRLQISD